MEHYDNIRNRHPDGRAAAMGRALEAVKRHDASRSGGLEGRRGDVIEAAKTICDAVNGMKPEEVAELLFIGFSTSHRTLQSQGVAALVDFFRVYQDAAYDLRNLNAVVASAQIAAFARDVPLVFPLI